MKPDQENIDIVRESVRQHIRLAAKKWDKKGMMVLDVAPEVHKGAAEFFKHATIETLDINPKSQATHIFDLTDRVILNASYLLKRYDCIICTEVLEHVYEPKRAVNNLRMMLKNHGEAYVTTPFNLRIHNPLPDLWRFTEHGLRHLFEDWTIQSLTQAETQGRELMPISYRLIVSP